MAADVNGDGAINQVDIIAIQRFFLGLSTGSPMLERISSILRAAPIRRLVATRPLRITTHWSSATLLLLL
jgi:hypothetical protein